MIFMDSFSGKLGKPIWNIPCRRSFCRSQNRGPGVLTHGSKDDAEVLLWVIRHLGIDSVFLHGFWGNMMIIDDQRSSICTYIDDHLLKKKTWLSNTFDLTAILTVFECVWLWLQHSLNLLETSMPSSWTIIHERHCSTCHAVLYTAPLGFSHPCPAPGMLVDTPGITRRCTERMITLTAASWRCSHLHGCDDLVEKNNLYPICNSLYI